MFVRRSQLAVQPCSLYCAHIARDDDMHDPYCQPREALRYLSQHTGAIQPALRTPPCNQRVCQGVVYRFHAREHMLQSLTSSRKCDARYMQ